MGTTPTVFVSYRRSDDAAIVERLTDRLFAAFGEPRVFYDVQSIPKGFDFPSVIQQRMAGSDVVLLAIGRAFVSERLQDEGDHLRIEIVTALTLGLPILPVLLGDATMPPASSLPPSLARLADLNAARLRSGADFNPDAERVIGALRELARTAGPVTAPVPRLGASARLGRRRSPWRRSVVVGVGVASLAVGGVAAAVVSRGGTRTSKVLDTSVVGSTSGSTRVGSTTAATSFPSGTSTTIASVTNDPSTVSPVTAQAPRSGGGGFGSGGGGGGGGTTSGQPGGGSSVTSPAPEVTDPPTSAPTVTSPPPVTTPAPPPTFTVDKVRDVNIAANAFSVAFKPDGSRLAIGDSNGQVQIWDTATWVAPKISTAAPRQVLAVAWSSDGTRLASAVSGPSGFRVHDAGSLVVAATVDQYDAMGLAWSPIDAQRVAVAGLSGSSAVWSGASGAWTRGDRLGDQVLATAWRPDGQVVAMVGRDRLVHLLTSTGGFYADLSGHQAYILAAAWSPDGEILATADEAGVVRLWGADGAPKGAPITTGQGVTRALAWSPTSDHLVAAGADGTARFYTRDGAMIGDPYGAFSSAYPTVAWSADGLLVFGGQGDSQVHVYRTANG